MTASNLLKKWEGIVFESPTSKTTEFKSFVRNYKAFLKAICDRNDFELIKFSVGYFEFSGFIRNNNKFVYFSISDVRYFPNAWNTNILIRTAKSDRDYAGDINNRTTLEKLESSLLRMFENGSEF